MPDTSQITPVLIPLISVVVGGIIGIAGGLIGPLMLERRKEASEKKKKRAEKFEELVGAVVEHYQWIGARPAPTARALIVRNVGRRGPFWKPIWGPDRTPIDTLAIPPGRLLFRKTDDRALIGDRHR
jgi:hypothetical protein